MNRFLMSTQKHLVVIGGGAAGFFCAVNAARLNPQLRVTILEKSSKLLSKVRISGGGRCNLSHACFDITAMCKNYPRGTHFLRKTFHRFFTKDTIEWFEKRGVKLKAEADGRMFPVSDSSQSVIDCLLREAGLYGVNVRTNREVQQLRNTPNGWTIQCTNGDTMEADHVCVAAGGYPRAAMFSWIKELGHQVSDPVPSLFTFNMPGHAITKLMGLSVEKARVKINDTKLMQEGPVLITHWGLSGPAILKLSAWGARELKERNWDFNVSINWIPGIKDQEFGALFQDFRMQKASRKITNSNPFNIPQRLWDYFLEEAGIINDLRWADLSSKGQNKLIGLLSNSQYSINGKTTFKEEFVTAGGVNLSEVDANTMMSKLVPGLYFAGEILDVDGVTGGFNFQHAWSSGYIAAEHISRVSDE